MNVMNYGKCGNLSAIWEFSKSSYSANRSDTDATATANPCKSVKSVFFYIYRHRLTPIYTDFT
jgi:hypothetical protein